jgi:16S rRNA (guanine(966)-N(2))-methyltransferase RsmD
MADKIKEAVFSALEALGVDAARVLDLYAGTGAVGIEALSRGADWADFVDAQAAACTVIRENLAHTKLASRAEVHNSPVNAFLRRRGKPYDLIFVDPPYADPDILPTLERIASSSLVVPGSVIVLGHSPQVERLRAGRQPDAAARPLPRRELLLDLRGRSLRPSPRPADPEPSETAGMRIAIYPGSFDPITFGHIDVARARPPSSTRSSSPSTRGRQAGGLFEAPTRVAFARDAPRRPAERLRRHLLRAHRRLRPPAAAPPPSSAASGRLRLRVRVQARPHERPPRPEIEVVCLMTSSRHSFISSSLIREVASLGGDLDGLVPDKVRRALVARFPGPIRSA